MKPPTLRFEIQFESGEPLACTVDAPNEERLEEAIRKTYERRRNPAPVASVIATFQRSRGKGRVAYVPGHETFSPEEAANELWLVIEKTPFKGGGR